MYLVLFFIITYLSYHKLKLWFIYLFWNSISVSAGKILILFIKYQIRMYIQQSIPQITIHLLHIDTLQQVNCDIMYIQQTAPQITIHLLYIDTLQHVDCGIMYIQQNTPQITIHLLYIDTLQQVNCDIMYIQQSIPQITIHLLYIHHTTGEL